MTEGLGVHAPKYQRIADALRRDIKAGVYPPGEQLPAETAIRDRFRDQLDSLSMPTVRQAIAVLRAEGLVESRQGIGTFVKDNRKLQRRSRHRYGRARRDRQLLTRDLVHEILFAGLETVPKHIADAAPDLTEGESVVIRRRLLHDPKTGHPEEIGASYVPTSIAAGTYLESTDVVPKALFLCVEELSGKHYTHARDQWEVRPATAEETSLLKLTSGAFVIHLIHCAYGEDKSLLEVSESIWPANRIVVIDEYNLAQEPEDDEGLSDV